MYKFLLKNHITFTISYKFSPDIIMINFLLMSICLWNIVGNLDKFLHIKAKYPFGKKELNSPFSLKPNIFVNILFYFILLVFIINLT